MSSRTAKGRKKKKCHCSDERENCDSKSESNISAELVATVRRTTREIPTDDQLMEI